MADAQHSAITASDDTVRVDFGEMSFVLRRSSARSLVRVIESALDKKDADVIRDNAERVAKERDERRKHLLDNGRVYRDRMLELCKNGFSRSKAITHLADINGGRRDIIEASINMACREAGIEKDKRRDDFRDRVIHMVSEGWSRDKIAKELGIHKNSVDRILRKFKKPAVV